MNTNWKASTGLLSAGTMGEYVSESSVNNSSEVATRLPIRVDGCQKLWANSDVHTFYATCFRSL